MTTGRTRVDPLAGLHDAGILPPEYLQWPHSVIANRRKATLIERYGTSTHLGARYRLEQAKPGEPLRVFTVPRDFASVFEAHHLTTMVAAALEEGW